MVNIIPYFQFPDRLGLVMKAEERAEVFSLLSRRNQLVSDLPIWDPDEYKSVETFEAVYEDKALETVEERKQIHDRLVELYETIEERYANQFNSPEEIYGKALPIINKFPLTLDKEAQKRHLSLNTLPLMGTTKGKRVYNGVPYVRTSFNNLPPDDRLPTCVFFIGRQADIQNYIAVLERKGWDTNPINDAITERAKYLISPEGELEAERQAREIAEELKAEAREHTKKVLAKQAEEQATAEVEPIPQPEYFLLPTSSTTFVFSEVLGAGPELDSLPKRKKAVSHGSKYEIGKMGTTRRVVYHGAETVTLEITDITKLPAHGAPTEKWLNRALEKINEQALYNGELTQDYISFPLQEAVDDGQYTNIRSARRGFEDASRTLSSVKGEKRGKDDFALEVFFTGAHIKKGQCYLFLNPRTAWEKVAGKYYTVMPKYYYALPDKASTLLRYVFYIARQRTNDINKRGYFTISLRSIQMHLNIPDEKTTKNPRRDIKDPIENAVEKIEEKHLETFNDTSLQFELLYGDGLTIPDDLSISEYLDNGYLKVMLDNDLAGYFIGVFSKNARKRIEAERKEEHREALKQAKLEALKENRKN